MRDLKYGFRLKHPWNFCALQMGECPCAMNATNDRHAGDGVVPGKTADQIKTMPRMDM